MSDRWKLIGEAVSLVLAGALILALVSSLSLLVAWPVKWCWNYTMPHLFGWPAIDWGRAYCLMLLVALLSPARVKTK